jgi:hypothetical protein
MDNTPATESEDRILGMLDHLNEESARRFNAKLKKAKRSYKVTRIHERRFLAEEHQSEAFRAMFAPLRRGPFQPKRYSVFGTAEVVEVRRCGRICRACGRFKGWFDPRTLRANFHRQTKSVTGFLPTCRECTNKARRRRRVELGMTRRSRKPV